jgi:hypothetical protein
MSPLNTLDINDVTDEMIGKQRVIVIDPLAFERKRLLAELDAGELVLDGLSEIGESIFIETLIELDRQKDPTDYAEVELRMLAHEAEMMTRMFRPRQLLSDEWPPTRETSPYNQRPNIAPVGMNRKQRRAANKGKFKHRLR